MLGVSYTFIAYVWFILCNDFLTTNKLPHFLETFATKVLKRIWFWKFDDVEPFYRICIKAKAKVHEKDKSYNVTNDNLKMSESKQNYVANTEFSFLSAMTDFNLNDENNVTTILPVIINTDLSNEKNTHNSTDNIDQTKSPVDSNPSKNKCNSCDLCENCQKDKQKDKDKKKKKDLTESNVSALNHFACFLLICTELICNMTVWLIISNPPSSYSST